MKAAIKMGDSFNKHLCSLFLILLIASCGSSPSIQGDAREIRIDKTLYEGRPHFLVRTRTASYYYDIRGGGFSRIMDKEGNDWISFRMEPWDSYPASASSSYRGLPNLVYQGEDDGAGHPGHDQCKSRAESNRIITESLSGRWKWSWEFHEEYAVFEMIRTDPERSYWFLYEGTPGGQFSPAENYFGSSIGGPRGAGYDYFSGNVLPGRFHWMYAGSLKAPSTFFMIQLEDDSLNDLVAFLGNTETGLESPDGMTVFGFGRDRNARPLLKGKQRFIIGFFPERIENKTGHRRLSRYIETTFLKF